MEMALLILTRDWKACAHMAHWTRSSCQGLGKASREEKKSTPHTASSSLQPTEDKGGFRGEEKTAELVPKPLNHSLPVLNPGGRP